MQLMIGVAIGMASILVLFSVFSKGYDFGHSKGYDIGYVDGVRDERENNEQITEE